MVRAEIGVDVVIAVEAHDRCQPQDALVILQGLRNMCLDLFE